MNLSTIKFKDLDEIERFMRKHADQTYNTYSIKGELICGLYIDTDNFVLCYCKTKDDILYSAVMKENRVIMAYFTDISCEEYHVTDEYIEDRSIIDISENGNRWEGNAFLSMPFGWGKLLDENNSILYEGFMFDKVYMGYGTAYHTNSNKIYYQGYFCNGQTHGYGKFYDLHGNLLSEGLTYHNSQPINKLSVSMKGKLENVPSLLSNTLETIYVDKASCPEQVDFCIVDMPELRSIKVGNNCFSKKCFRNYRDFANSTPEEEKMFGSFCIRSCPKLKELFLGAMSFNNMNSCEFSNLPLLEVLTIPAKSFYVIHSLHIKGNYIY